MHFTISTGSDRSYPSHWPPQAFQVSPSLVRPVQEKALRVLVATRASETAVDTFLRGHPELLAACLNFTSFGHHGTWIVPQQVILPPQLPISNGLKPDYLVGGKGSEGFSWFVVELKSVRNSLFAGSRRSLRLSTVANRGLMQLLGYISYCSTAQSYLRETLHLTGFREPQGFLIIGSERELEESPERQMARQALNHAFAGRVQIRTFDALLRSQR
jgi:Domain of unknown function (DUF4263)